MTGTPDILALLARAKKGGRKKGKKGRKIGRSKRHPAAQRYLIEKRWQKNKPLRVARHLRRHPKDAQALGAYHRLAGKHWQEAA